jgi:hypothetical protein
MNLLYFQFAKVALQQGMLGYAMPPTAFLTPSYPGKWRPGEFYPDKFKCGMYMDGDIII